MILLTGGTGFLGSYLLFELLQQGKEVTALRREGSSMAQIDMIWKELNRTVKPSSPLTTDMVQWVIGDMEDSFRLMEILSERHYDQVIHAAARLNFRWKYRMELSRVNVDGTAALADACLAAEVGSLVFISSIAAVDRKQDEVATEENWIQSNVFKNPYSESKYLAEMEVWRANAEGLPVVIINPGVILGWGLWNSGSPAIYKTVYDGLSIYPIGSNAFVDARDVAKATVMLASVPSTWGERYICGGHNISHQQLFEMISAEMKVKAPSRRLGPTLASWVGRASEWKSALMGTEPFISREMAETVSRRYSYSSDKLLTALPGFSFRPLAETIADDAEVFMNTFLPKRRN